MAKYAQLTDITDTSLRVIENDLQEADSYIDALLQQKGIDPSSVQGSELLKHLAVYFACYRASIRLAQTEDTIYIDKAKLYEKLYKEKARQVDINTLGIFASPPATVEVGRA